MARSKKSYQTDISRSPKSTGTLFVVATPIGNLEDITLRALRVLKEVDFIAAEDTRHTRKLLTHFGITTSTISYYKEKEQARTADIIEKLRQGLNVALVSDAGTPGISDPGAVLVRKVWSENLQVVPIPGPSSLAAALSVAGLTDDAFVFLGFAPARKKQRQDLLHAVKWEKRTLIFFEAPHRIAAFLEDCLAVLGDRQVFWGRELTKMHEEISRNAISVILSRCKSGKTKGESVLLVSGATDEPRPSLSEIEGILAAARQSGIKSLKETVQEVSLRYGLSRSTVYQMALRIWHNK